MNQGVYPLAAAMVNQLNRVDTISNNLANQNTTGFKQEGLTEGTFNHYLERMQQQNQTPTKISTVTNNIPKLDGKYIDQSKGVIRQTGNNLDFALKEKDTFFQVMNDKGEIELTKDGTFHNLDGILVTKQGYAVLSPDGEPIAIEDETFGQQIAVVKTPFDNLEKIGSNNYRIKDEAMTDLLAENEGYVLQGALETSNVNGVTAMVALIDAHRRFEQAQKAVNTIDTLNQSLIEKVGRPS